MVEIIVYSFQNMIFQSVVYQVSDHDSQLIRLLDFSQLCSKACQTNQRKKLKQKHQQIIDSLCQDVSDYNSTSLCNK